MDTSLEHITTIVARLRTEFNIDIADAALPDNLRCVACRSVLLDACQVPCGCKICRRCIDQLMASGHQSCPGFSRKCRDSLLARFVADYRANRDVVAFPMECPNRGCLHECPLAGMEEHLRVCPRRTERCPFWEFGCMQDQLSGEDMAAHLQQASASHGELLIGMVANINNEMTALRHSEEANKRKIEMLEQRDDDNKKQIKELKRGEEDSKREIEMLKRGGEANRREIEWLHRGREENRDEIERLKHEQARKDEQIGIIMNEFGLIRDAIRSAKEERDLADGMKILSDKIALRVGVPDPTGRADAICEYTLDGDVRRTLWTWPGRLSACFHGDVYPYKYRLLSCNIGSVGRGSLCIHLLLLHGDRDALLAWPFSARVTITVADKDRPLSCRSNTRQCDIERPSPNQYSSSSPFFFLHSVLAAYGLRLGRGVRVSCAIVPAAGRVDDAN